MTDTAPDYRQTVFLPKTDFPMKAGLAQSEPKWLARWQTLGLYDQVRQARHGAPKFILHDGPPYANGDMHLGHAMNHILKDVVCRTQGLLGKDAPYVPGWDCHGLPIEWKVEEQYRKAGKSKDAVDPIAFRAECRAYAQKWVDTQRAQLQRLGVMGRWDKPYLTMDFEAEAIIAAELMKFAESGQLYCGAKPVMWSPVEQTALAEAEVEYEDITSTQVDVGFEILSASHATLIGAKAVIWTTTPWTLPVNCAIAYGADVDYVCLSAAGQNYIVAEALVEAFAKRAGLGDVHIAERFKGTALAGATARHPLHALSDFFATPRPLLAGDFVTTDAGTGLVHMAPDHGEDDFYLCKNHGIDPLFVVQPDGSYLPDWPVVGGHHVYKVNAPDGAVCTALREAGGLLAASADYRHSYPHSWRSKAKLIYRCTPQWFVAMDRPLEDGKTLRARALEAISATRFLPAVGENRIRAMVEGRPDWVLSRQRAWGVPITIFVKKGTREYLRDTAVNQRIASAIRAGGADAWYTANPQDLLGPEYRAEDYEPVRDILDVWFDSGSTHAFVLESGRWPELHWPADLYLEGSDQHRGWFQSSLLESCGTRGRAPYKQVLTHGFALDQQGRKMSKSLGNTVDPLKIINESGADILRLWTVMTNFTEDVRIGKEILAGTTDSYRKIRNTFRYLLGALEGFGDAERVAAADMPELERWVLHRLAELSQDLARYIDDFDFTAYVAALQNFCVSDLSAFYFDIRKDSLYCDKPTSPTRKACRTVLDHIFHALMRWYAPVLVFTTEEAWQQRFPSQTDSVHLQTWPAIEAGWQDAALGAKWARLREIRSLVTEAIEPLRREKIIGSSLKAHVQLGLPDAQDRALVASVPFAEIAIIASLQVNEGQSVLVSSTDHAECARCWRHMETVAAETQLCGRCTEAVGV